MRGGHLVRDARHQIELRGPDWQKLRSPMTVALAPGQATNLISRLRTKLLSLNVLPVAISTAPDASSRSFQTSLLRQQSNKQAKQKRLNQCSSTL